jgi:MFS transporter, AAHS family, 4-hydroxybenzoate transporter
MMHTQSNGAASAGIGTAGRVFLLCALVAFADGFDTQSIGPAARSIAAALGFETGAFGIVFSASQLGFLLGAACFGTLGDRFGRKRSLIVTITVFAAASLGTAFASSYPVLILLRLAAGVGLGGASPNFISLAASQVSPVQRARIVTFLWAAVPFGGMVGSFASSALLPLFGWQSIFLVGGVAPLLLLPLLAGGLPESRSVRDEGQAPVSPGAVLFGEGRATATIWLWLASFMTWTTLVVTAFWTPLLLQKVGWSDANAALLLALNNLGGVLGVMVTGSLLTWLNPDRALQVALVATSAFLLLVGISTASAVLLPVAVLLAGFFASAAGGAVLAVSAGLYPSASRATGVGWALSFGRLGTIIGPAVIGLVVARQWPTAGIYGLIAMTALTGALCVELLARARTKIRLAPT